MEALQQLYVPILLFILGIAANYIRSMSAGVRQIDISLAVIAEKILSHDRRIEILERSQRL